MGYEGGGPEVAQEQIGLARLVVVDAVVVVVAAVADSVLAGEDHHHDATSSQSLSPFRQLERTKASSELWFLFLCPGKRGRGGG